jgi:hypothetical protein
MRFRLSNKATRQLIAGIMLLAFAARALVPQGFMPASDGLLRVRICPEGFRAQLLVHSGHHHGETPSDTEHCVFGSACFAGPVPHLPPLTGILPAPRVPRTPFISTAILVQLFHLPYARGPPAAA